MDIVGNNKDLLNAISNAITEDDSIDLKMLEYDPIVGPTFVLVVAVAAFVAAVAVVIAGAVTHFGAATAMDYVAVGHHCTVVETGCSGSETTYINPFISTNDPHLWQIWILKNSINESAYVMSNEYNEAQVNTVMNAVYETYPDAVSSINKDKLKQFISLNISQIYEIYAKMSEN